MKPRYVPATGSRSAHADAKPRALPEATPRHLPRWRGFNLLNKFMADHQSAFDERDFPTRSFYNGNPWFLPLVGCYFHLRDRLDRLMA